MTTHLSARIAWHDSAWNGAICKAPECNTSCIVHDYIRESRDDRAEAAAAGKAFADLTDYVPPCYYEAATYGDRGYPIVHKDPVEGRGLPPCPDKVEPYSTFTTPYRWMREENFADICQAEGLNIRACASGKSHGWVTEDDRQRALLKAFWDKLQRGKSLVFYYCKDGNPINDEIGRLIIGVGRISEIGSPAFFGKHPKIKGQFPVWARQVTQTWPREGVRIPYQEYLSRGLSAEPIACVPPPNQQFRFSYVAEHLTDGVAALTLDRIIRSIERVRSDQAISGYDYDGALQWLNGALDEVWSGRGAYPGIGALLRALGCEQGIHYQYAVLAAVERKGADPWQHVRAILSGMRTEPSASYAAGLAAAGEKWRALSTRHELMDALVRFELTSDQMLDLLSETDRIRRGITASPKEIVDNPFMLAEQDLGTDTSEPISLDLIDQGVRPEGAARRFGTPWTMPQDDKRRVRAVVQAVLANAAGEGHTFLPVSTLLASVRALFPERRECRPDEEVFLDQGDFHGQVLQFDEIDEVPVAALRALRQREQRLADLLQGMTRKSYPDAPAIDWKAQLRTVFDPPESEREHAALAEKEIAFEVLYRQRVSVLIGGAGVGKTKALQVFVNSLVAAEGMQPMLLLAPTGKARVRLAESTRRRAQTVHQVLRKQELIGPRLTLKDSTTVPSQRVSTIIIDEASMLSVDLLACLLRAVNTDAIRRLILVGDPHQLPPIGPGRPFGELIEWLRLNAPRCIGELFTCMRTVEVDGEETVSPGLELASTYRDDAHPGDDAILARLARRENLGDVEIDFWNTPGDLHRLIQTKLKRHAAVEEGDFKSFNRSLGFDTDDWQKAESWQILSPTRGEPYGTNDLNRLIQKEFRGRMLAYARNPYNQMPPPFGDEEIVKGDKVINIRNSPAFCKPQESGLSYLVNGEIALVSNTYSSQYGDKLCAVFTTQPDAVYILGRDEARDRLELAYALTVHKAQGSDFGQVFFVLPQQARTLSRELLYTALTRFRERLIILAERDIAPLVRLRAADTSDSRRRCSRLFHAYVPTGLLPTDDPRTPIYSERLKHRTGEGVKVRSKSEVIVAYALERVGLQPLYEVPLYAKNGDPTDFKLPDFTIMFEGETWYWEHLGMLSKPKYSADWQDKKAWYTANGYWERVVTSEDGSDGSIQADTIEAIARVRILESV
jgi:exodeoxyribonuclease V alpha subunit